MSVKVKGANEVAIALKAAGIDINVAIDNAVRTTAFHVLRAAVKSIQTESSGKTYGNHVASAPGDAPNTDTGRLAGSIQVAHDRGSKVAFVGTNLDYGYYLEKDKDRPWLEPALEGQNEKLPERITKEIQKALKRKFG